jgi:hypothetical protein
VALDVVHGSEAVDVLTRGGEFGWELAGVLYD